MALLQWNQLAAMNRHYVHYSLRDFFSTQQKLGIREICLWAGAPHLLLDDESRPDATALLALAGSTGFPSACWPQSAHCISILSTVGTKRRAKRHWVTLRKPFC